MYISVWRVYNSMFSAIIPKRDTHRDVDRLYPFNCYWIRILLSKIIYKSLSAFSFPVCWKSFSAGPFFRTLGNNLILRTVSALPYFSHVLEAVINYEFVKHLTSQGLHSYKQSGFRFSNSIADWATFNTERTCQALQKNSATPAVFCFVFF